MDQTILPPGWVFGLTVAAGLWTGYFIRRFIEKKFLKSAERHAQQIVIEAGASADRLKQQKLVEGREVLQAERDDLEREVQAERVRLREIETQVLHREQTLDRRHEELRGEETGLEKRAASLDVYRLELDQTRERFSADLERVSGMTRDQARQALFERMTNEARVDAAKVAKKYEEDARRIAERKAQTLVVGAVQRLASNVIQEHSISVVVLPSDDMKGRIIGREGRNIREFEKMTGVDVIIDDTPETVVLSCFDPFRRELARVTMSQLVTDGRIHPARIEEVYRKAVEDMDGRLIQIGEEAMYEVGVSDLPEPLVRLLGQLKFRTSYGQNVLAHSLEVGRIAALMAEEIGANARLVRRVGLLHDIGKAVSHEMEGPHALVGAQIAAKHGESEDVTNGIAAHHGEREPNSVESVLIAAADAISASRPGARLENVESYFKRLDAIEALAREYPSVEKAYAIQAGREIRAILRNEQISDEQMEALARDLAKKIEETIDYPGQIKVTCIRESRVIDYAR